MAAAQSATKPANHRFTAKMASIFSANSLSEGEQDCLFKGRYGSKLFLGMKSCQLFWTNKQTKLLLNILC